MKATHWSNVKKNGKIDCKAAQRLKLWKEKRFHLSRISVKQSHEHIEQP